MASIEHFSSILCLVLLLLCMESSLVHLTGVPEMPGNEYPSSGEPNELRSGTCTQALYPRDCQEVYYRFDEPCDGVYLIKPDGYPEPFEVFCNNTFDSGGWTVLQRRMDGGVNFYRNWNDYKHGFGFLHREFWLGNEKISHLTNQKDFELRIDVMSTSGSMSYARYDLFRISDEGTHYKLVELGSYQGNIGSVTGFDYMDTHRNKAFSTLDADHDNYNDNCARNMRGGWWYNYCYYANLNGDYHSQTSNGICLWDDVNSIQCGIHYTEMKIRPKEHQGRNQV